MRLDARAALAAVFLASPIALTPSPLSAIVPAIYAEPPALIGAPAALPSSLLAATATDVSGPYDSHECTPCDGHAARRVRWVLHALARRIKPLTPNPHPQPHPHPHPQPHPQPNGRWTLPQENAKLFDELQSDLLAKPAPTTKSAAPKASRAHS